MSTPYLSIVIVAQDEERTIAQVLDAVKAIASEIILIDSGSTDRTVEIAKKRGAMCHYREWHGYADQKNYAISLAKSPWILSLDADEIVSDGLLSEIENVLSAKSSEQFAGFTIPRILYIGEQALMHGGFYPDAQLRLFRQGQGQFNDRVVHESIKVTGKVGKLKNAILHYAYPDLAAFAHAMDKYARLSAREFAKRLDSNCQRRQQPVLEAPASRRFVASAQGAHFEDLDHGTSGEVQHGANSAIAKTAVLDSEVKPVKARISLSWRTSKLNELLHPCWTFFYRYIIRGGFLDGALGLKMNLIYSGYVKKKITYLRESLAEVY